MLHAVRREAPYACPWAARGQPRRSRYVHATLCAADQPLEPFAPAVRLTGTARDSLPASSQPACIQLAATSRRDDRLHQQPP